MVLFGIPESCAARADTCPDRIRSSARQVTRGTRAVGHQQLGGIDARQLIGKLFDADIDDGGVAGRDIGPGEREVGGAVAEHSERREIVGRARRQEIIDRFLGEAERLSAERFWPRAAAVPLPPVTIWRSPATIALPAAE